MFGSPRAATLLRSGTLPARPTHAAEEQAAPDPAVAIAAKALTVARGRAIADVKRTILPDPCELRKVARRRSGISISTACSSGLSCPPAQRPKSASRIGP
jgi:hypothetical protein